MIKFITENNSENTFSLEMVTEDQFFINDGGFLCQKINRTSYQIIADERGIPFADRREASPTDKILRILPHVTKIEF